ncbi:DUF3168 domain-containing protein [Devosia neptuniae]|jgi:hypothetical protein|uniref:DUF3168 domain-containing protein n=1 Tax=Devosia neptuniae TaxID=191302 RepID=UPI0022B07C72|nr:DUF3168 domain-containing protein [Devosia neptuniae]MCZ4344882.1 DUF3168 domain-containing protein [Devosia neptuniae]|tara:strand:- start:31235 stop:31633 length:399 start_codon:yes stop_codon:yes gene_type:complete
MHPITLLQTALVAALKADVALTAIIGDDGVFDAAPRGRAPPYVLIARHDVLTRNVDLAPGQEHRLQLHCWGDQPSRQRALDMAERVVAVTLALEAPELALSHIGHVRTDTVIDDDTGLARAAVAIRVFSAAS